MVEISPSDFKTLYNYNQECVVLEKRQTQISGAKQRTQKHIHINMTERIFHKCAKAIQWKKFNFFQRMVLEKFGHPCTQKMNFDLNLISYTKINSKWSTDLKVRCKTIKLLEKNRRKSLWPGFR